MAADRTMTRSVYDLLRRMAWAAKRDAALLAGTKWQGADTQRALRLREELQPPADPIEAARELRLNRLRNALRVSQRAKVLRDQARRIAREGVSA